MVNIEFMLQDIVALGVLIHLLSSPRPYSLLPVNYLAVAESERRAARERYRLNPPAWVVKRTVRSDRVPVSGMDGHRDHAFHVVLPSHTNSPVADTAVADGAHLCEMLPSSSQYREVLNNGYARVWRLEN